MKFEIYQPAFVAICCKFMYVLKQRLVNLDIFMLTPPMQIELTDCSGTSARKIRKPGNHPKECIKYGIVVTKLIFTKILLLQQLLVKKFFAEFHENVADLSLVLDHEQMEGLVDRHDILT